jgi:hypothetical protein
MKSTQPLSASDGTTCSLDDDSKERMETPEQIAQSAFKLLLNMPLPKTPIGVKRAIIMAYLMGQASQDTAPANAEVAHGGTPLNSPTCSPSLNYESD